MGISKQITDADGKVRRLNNYVHVKKFRANKKAKLVKLFGGCCCVCAYNKTIRNLHFHHVNPKEKSFGISSGGNRLSFDKILAEAKKCILVCSNCHGEIHDGLIDATQYYKEIMVG